jgi:K+-transporting ATPase ATPase B chain
MTSQNISPSFRRCLREHSRNSGVLNVMGLKTPQSAVLSAVIFNALIIIALVPLALRGVKYVPAGAEELLRRNLLIYGLGGVIAPFLGIKLIDEIITHIGLA